MAESVLQQPPVPVPIVAVQGGGGVTDSVLPQPAAGGEVPIIPVQGGGGTRAMIEYKPFNIPRMKILLPKQVMAPNIKNYFTLRSDLWTDNITTDIPTNIATIGNIKKNILLTTEDTVVVFIVYSEIEFNKVIQKINEYLKNTEISKTFVILSAIDKQVIFSNVFKKFVDFITKITTTEGEDPINIYFLHDSKYPILYDERLEPTLKKQRDAFLKLEPTYITLQFTKGGVKKNLVLTTLTAAPDDIKTDYILISSNSTGAITLQLNPKEKLDLTTLEENKNYTVDKTKFEVGYMEIFFHEVDDTPTITATRSATPAAATPAATPATPAAPAATAATPTAAAAPPPAAAVAKPTVKPYLIQLRPEVTIDIGGTIFTIQKPTDEVMKAWKAGTFSDSEVAMFKEIGINEDFLKEPHSKRKKSLLDRRAGFLQNLVLNQCFKAQNIRYECDMVREFLQDLLELKQIERLNKITRAFSPTNVNVEIGDNLNKNVTAPGPESGSDDKTILKLEEMLGSLFTVVPDVKKRNRVESRPDLDLAGFISPYSGLESLLLGTTASRSSKKTAIPTGALSFSSLFSSSTPAVAFSPGVSHTRKKFTTLPSFDFSGLFRKKTAGGAKNTTRRRRSSAKP